MASDSAFRVRRAGIEDAQGILDCLHSAFEPYRKQYTPAAFQDTVLSRDTIEQRLADMTVFVAITDAGRIIGTIGCKPENTQEGHIRGMAVDPERQASGVAQRLLESVEAELRDRGCSVISLDTTQPLQRAIRFYERNGFRATGKVTDFFGMPLYEYVKRLE
ncbi:MAG: GNAT family N-acetyltransferase [Acidobacteria bacterium]|nr:GNAT family N-acetyltransferase [Acidobacteriota bacterium]